MQKKPRHAPRNCRRQQVARLVSAFVDPAYRPLLLSPEFLTFLVSDIESFTPTIHELGDALGREFITTHDEIVRDCLHRHHGVEIAHTGDGVIASFKHTSHAMHCASAIQHALTRHNEHRPIAPIHVRIGIHTGCALQAGSRLVGTNVNTAVRLCSVAEADQVLVSQSSVACIHRDWFVLYEREPVALKGLPDRLEIFEFDWRLKGRLESN